jgi:hypothetical protein
MRNSRLVAAGSVALMAAGLIATGSGVPASATTYHPGYICSDSGYNDCLHGNGSGKTVTAITGGSTTNFQEIREGTWDGHPMYEYQQADTNLCLEWEYKNSSGKVVNYVRMATCDAGTYQKFYWNSNDMLVNEDWTNYYSTQGCLYAPGPTEDVYVETCNVTVEDQMFYASNGT